MKKALKIPYPTIERLALYSRPLETLLEDGSSVTSSEKIAELCGVSPAQVRKDLACFGEFGVRGVGYYVADLLSEIKKILATDREWKLCIVGLGSFGNALVEDANFKKRGYKFMAAFDADQNKIGKTLPCGLIIESPTKLKALVQDLGIEIGIITTPPREAQGVADMLADSGIKAILNFASLQIRAPQGCVVENIDFTVKLENLAYHLGKIF
ncbi:MAG: redox-sensing transcriptional repressor Rex [Desulfobacterales bacterium]|nr:redox-sensing transcriptional repressor Rex [Desulfobacterales bacterium]